MFFLLAGGAVLAHVSPKGSPNHTCVTHDFVLKCNTCALSPHIWVTFHYCRRDAFITDTSDFSHA